MGRNTMRANPVRSGTDDRTEAQNNQIPPAVRLWAINVGTNNVSDVSLHRYGNDNETTGPGIVVRFDRFSSLSIRDTAVPDGWKVSKMSVTAGPSVRVALRREDAIPRT